MLITLDLVLQLATALMASIKLGSEDKVHCQFCQSYTGVPKVALLDF